ncbi:unnamed protein product [Scytosiphon promiscuus]
MTNTSRRWAATAAGIIALYGGSQCHAFLVSGRVALPQQQSCRSHRCSSRSANIMSADRVDLSAPAAGSTAVVAEVDDGNSGSTSSLSNAAGGSAPSNDDDVAVARTETKGGGTKDAAKEAGRRWIKEMKAGDKVIGYVADTTKFAAFVDCSVVRRGAKDKIMPVTGFLHLADIKPPYALEGTPLARECEVEVKKGIHLTAYVKDVFPNAGRMTLSLDPNINKDKVLKLRHSKRQRSRTNRRERLHKKGLQPAVGDVVEGYVREVRDSMLLVDVMFAQLSVLRVNKIRNSGEGGKFVNLQEKAKPGDVITVRIEDIDTSKRRGAKDDKATIDFVGWGGLDANAIPTDGRLGDDAPAGEPSSFDIAAEIDALPNQRPTDAAPSLDSGSAAPVEAEDALEEER